MKFVSTPSGQNKLTGEKSFVIVFFLTKNEFEQEVNAVKELRNQLKDTSVFVKLVGLP